MMGQENILVKRKLNKTKIFFDKSMTTFDMITYLAKWEEHTYYTVLV